MIDVTTPLVCYLRLCFFRKSKRRSGRHRLNPAIILKRDEPPKNCYQKYRKTFLRSSIGAPAANVIARRKIFNVSWRSGPPRWRCKNDNLRSGRIIIVRNERQRDQRFFPTLGSFSRSSQPVRTISKPQQFLPAGFVVHVVSSGKKLTFIRGYYIELLN